MIPGCRLTTTARSQLREIDLYTRERFGARQARLYRDGFLKTFRRLVEFPESGRASYPGSLVRKAVYQSHTLFYRQTSQGIEIGRIFGPGQDFTEELHEYELYVLRQLSRAESRKKGTPSGET